MAKRMLCSRCSNHAQANGVVPKSFLASQLWSMPNDAQGSNRCPDCGHTNQQDAPLYMRTSFNEIDTSSDK